MNEENLKQELIRSVVRLNKSIQRPTAWSDLPQGVFMTLHTILQYGEPLDQGEEVLIGMTVSKLSEYLHVSRPASSRMLSELERRGFIQRFSSKHDRRLVYVCIAPAGKKVMEKAWIQVNESLDLLIEDVGAHDLWEMIRIMDKVHDTMKKYSASDAQKKKGIDAYDEAEKVL